jgi:hypothetical protein
MTISRRNFNALAKIVSVFMNDSNHRLLYDECTHVMHLAIAIADHCEEENPGWFQRDSFMQACGYHFVDGEGWRVQTHPDREATQ